MLEHDTLKDLQDKHPLFSRVSGQVVWLACEECGLNEEEITKVMDTFMEMREATLETMYKIENDDSSFLLIQIEESAARVPCPGCVRLNGRLVPAAHPRILEYLPPYSISCMCRAHCLNKAEASEYAAGKGVSIEALYPESDPNTEIYCQEDWLPESADH